MDYQKMIRDVVDWVENNLEHPLSLDMVSEKSGYSKWHLQRMFVEVTGISLGSYIRQRRLSKAAIDLRLSELSIADIIFRYRFDTQQTFSRAFKNQFQTSPRQYRFATEWRMEGIMPPIHAWGADLPAPRLVQLADTALLGVRCRHWCHIERLFDNVQEIHRHIPQPEARPVLYNIHRPFPTQTEGHAPEGWTAAFAPEKMACELNNALPVQITGGEYARFSYEGSTKGLQAFRTLLYDICLPSFNLTRRSGQDVERYRLTEGNTPWSHGATIQCDYFIPVTQESQIQ